MFLKNSVKRSFFLILWLFFTAEIFFLPALSGDDSIKEEANEYYNTFANYDPKFKDYTLPLLEYRVEALLTAVKSVLKRKKDVQSRQDAFVDFVQELSKKFRTGSSWSRTLTLGRNVTFIGASHNGYIAGILYSVLHQIGRQNDVNNQLAEASKLSYLSTGFSTLYLFDLNEARFLTKEEVENKKWEAYAQDYDLVIGMLNRKSHEIITLINKVKSKNSTIEPSKKPKKKIPGQRLGPSVDFNVFKSITGGYGIENLKKWDTIKAQIRDKIVHKNLSKYLKIHDNKALTREIKADLKRFFLKLLRESDVSTPQEKEVFKDVLSYAVALLGRNEFNSYGSLYEGAIQQLNENEIESIDQLIVMVRENKIKKQTINDIWESITKEKVLRASEISELAYSDYDTRTLTQREERKDQKDSPFLKEATYDRLYGFFTQVREYEENGYVPLKMDEENNPIQQTTTYVCLPSKNNNNNNNDDVCSSGLSRHIVHVIAGVSDKHNAFQALAAYYEDDPATIYIAYEGTVFDHHKGKEWHEHNMNRFNTSIFGEMLYSNWVTYLLLEAPATIAVATAGFAGNAAKKTVDAAFTAVEASKKWLRNLWQSNAEEESNKKIESEMNDIGSFVSKQNFVSLGNNIDRATKFAHDVIKNINKTNPKSKFIITGHSLGSFYAQFATLFIHKKYRGKAIYEGHGFMVPGGAYGQLMGFYTASQNEELRRNLPFVNHLRENDSVSGRGAYKLAGGYHIGRTIFYDKKPKVGWKILAPSFFYTTEGHSLHDFNEGIKNGSLKPEGGILYGSREETWKDGWNLPKIDNSLNFQSDVAVNTNRLKNQNNTTNVSPKLKKKKSKNLSVSPHRSP